MASESKLKKVTEASYYDTLRVFMAVILPTVAKGVIKRRPSVEALAQHHGLDTKAMQLLQALRKKYGPGPLYLGFPFRPQVLILNSEDAAQVLNETPDPFSSASKEKESSLSHFEPGNILISDPERRAELRPVHEHALATHERVHPFAERFKRVIDEELSHIFSDNDDKEGIVLDWDEFSQTWFRIIRRIVLGNAARDDQNLTDTLDTIRKRGNWGFTAPAAGSELKSFQDQIKPYIEAQEEGSLVSRLPKGHGLDLESQVAHWLFAFEPAGMAVFRALAVLASQPDKLSETLDGSNALSLDHPHSRAVVIDALRLWPTTPVILRELTKDHQVGGYMIEKGTGIIIFAPFFHRDNERLAFADQMNPSTFLSTEVDLSNGFVPFSAGPAMCPAHNFVPLVTSLAVDGLLSKAKIELLAPKMDPEALPGTLDHFQIKLRLSPRSNSAS